MRVSVAILDSAGHWHTQLTQERGSQGGAGESPQPTVEKTSSSRYGQFKYFRGRKFAQNASGMSSEPNQCLPCQAAAAARLAEVTQSFQNELAL
jgi:hypothetical protein